MLNPIFIILASMWSLGCVGGLVAMIVCGDTWGERLILTLIGVPLAFIAAIVPWGAAAYDQSPDLATLKKSEWVCSAAHDENGVMVMGNGVIIPTQDIVCDRYSRRGAK